MSQNLLRIGVVSLATILSRVLGLLRDILTFAVFGTTALHSAFIFAFTLPNLFRRLLGEGSLNAALVPVYTDELQEKGKARAWGLVNEVMSWLLLTSLLLCGLAILVFFLLPFWPGLPQRWYEGAELGKILFPYLIFIALAAMVSAALNVLQRFAVPALSAVWLNLSILFFLGGAALWWGETPGQKMGFLCAGVLFGGLLQFLIPAWALYREGWRPRLSFEGSARLRQVALLMVPGLAGTAIFQINVVVSRMLAFSLDEAAVSLLYLANRLMELPLGVFAIAVATVIFPLLSRYASEANWAAMGSAYRRGLRLIFVVTIPAGVGLIVLREPIVTALFQWGAFGAESVRQTGPILAIFALSIPFYAWASFSTRGFHSLKNTSTPVRIAGLSFLVNLACSLVFMRIWGTAGLALANLCSMSGQALLLQLYLSRAQAELRVGRIWEDLLKILFAGGVMAGVLVWWPAFSQWIESEKWAAVVEVCLLVPLGILLYGLIVWALRLEGYKDLQQVLSKMVRPGPRQKGKGA
ncbi:MAG: murein biosynthesis integral membrane protein MurJ [Opitutales bacterium]|nr:murein biosynthesis integral membrane protein MurJ [Opitutales bacterium]